MSEPRPRHIDYQDNARLPGYVRGVTHVRCSSCGTTGQDAGGAWCRRCGGYGCVPAPAAADQAQSAIEEKTR